MGELQKLVEGLHHFRKEVFSEKEALFSRLKKGQNPDVLFITCSDSRINPFLITNSEPGDLFVLRNAGNIIPPFGAGGRGEAAAVEFAITGLKVSQVVVCGHAHCGAMKGLVNPDEVKDLPVVAEWLQIGAEATRRIVQDNYADLSLEERHQACAEENVLVQLENLRTHPSVAAALSRGELGLHAWVYHFETGEVFAYNPDVQQFLSLTEE